MPTTAQPRRRRYGRAYANSRLRIAHSSAFAASVAAASARLPVAISVRVLTVPVPGGLDDPVELGQPRRPVELGARLLGRGVQDGRVAVAARTKRPGHVPAGHFLDGGDDFLHGMGASRAEIVRARPPGLDERLERTDVGVGEVADVDVVAQTGAVRRRIVVAEDLQPGPSAGGLDRARDD